MDKDKCRLVEVNVKGIEVHNDNDGGGAVDGNICDMIPDCTWISNSCLCCKAQGMLQQSSRAARDSFDKHIHLMHRRCNPLSLWSEMQSKMAIIHENYRSV